MAEHGKVHWSEFLSTDVEAAKAFFAETIGWSYEGMDMGSMTYWVAMHEGQPVAGVMPIPSNMPEGTRSHWMTYLAVDDVDARIAKAKDAGAMVMSEPFDVPGTGRIALLQDPSGGMIGWITPVS